VWRKRAESAQCRRMASAGSEEWILLGCVGIAQGRRAVGLRVPFSTAPAPVAAVDASIGAAGRGWRRREVRW
jgi:hypothetical protein